MAYTPIGWQTGDTITAEKLNRMDNGWSVTSGLQTYYDDNVTTTDANNREETIAQNPAFAGASELKVTFDSVEYSLTGFDDDGYWTWGAPYNDFSTYPFSIYINNGAASLVTQTAGTYALKIEAYGSSVDTSADFQSAVKSFITTPQILRCIENITNITDAQNYLNAGGIVYFTSPDTAGDVNNKQLYFINTPGNPCTIFPESTKLKAVFGRDDGLFRIYYL